MTSRILSVLSVIFGALGLTCLLIAILGTTSVENHINHWLDYVVGRQTQTVVPCTPNEVGSFYCTPSDWRIERPFAWLLVIGVASASVAIGMGLLGQRLNKSGSKKKPSLAA